MLSGLPLIDILSHTRVSVPSGFSFSLLGQDNKLQYSRSASLSYTMISGSVIHSCSISDNLGTS